MKHLERKGNTIELGFHFTIDEGKMFRKYKYSLGDVRYAVIPKGAEYCFGENNEVVSNKVIVFSNKEELDKYVSNC